MKTIFTLILITCLQGLVIGQNNLSPVIKTSTGVCSLSHDGSKWVAVHSDTVQHQCSQIVIMSLPPLTSTSTPMNLFITTRGSYTIKKDASLVIPEEYTVVMEDLLTGQYYNLRATEPYAFNLNRGFNQTRFLLGISKNSSKLTASK